MKQVPNYSEVKICRMLNVERMGNLPMLFHYMFNYRLCGEFIGQWPTHSFTAKAQCLLHETFKCTNHVKLGVGSNK